MKKSEKFHLYIYKLTENPEEPLKIIFKESNFHFNFSKKRGSLEQIRNQGDFSRIYSDENILLCEKTRSGNWKKKNV